jgi:hypothetical protein
MSDLANKTHDVIASYMHAGNIKRLAGLVLLVLVTVGIIANSMKESEKQKLGRLVESRCAMEGLSKGACKIKFVLAHLEATRQLVNRFAYESESAKGKMELATIRMELATIEKEEEALGSLGGESKDLLTENEMRILFHPPLHPSTGGVDTHGALSIVTKEDLLAMSAAIEEEKNSIK